MFWELLGAPGVSKFHVVFSKLNKFHTFFSKTGSGFRIFGIVGAKTSLSRLHSTIWEVIWDDFVPESPPLRPFGESFGTILWVFLVLWPRFFRKDVADVKYLVYELFKFKFKTGSMQQIFFCLR